MYDIVPSRRFGWLAAALLWLAFPSVSHAQDVSAWVADGHSAVRLLAGSRNGGVLLGGVGFKLDPGWKTYWRTPGDSGIPPRLDFSKSENVETVNVLWPAPKKFDDGAGGFSLGYLDQVVVPLRIVVKHADKPVTLRAHIAYAVCEKLCVPVEAEVELPFVSVASTQDSVLGAALDTVPKPANIGDPNPLTIRDVKRSGPRSVQVDVATPDAKSAKSAQGTDVELFVEGPTPEWALPIPKLVGDGPDGIKRFVFDLDGVPGGVDPKGAALKLTLVGGARAYEFNVSLD